MPLPVLIAAVAMNALGMTQQDFSLDAMKQRCEAGMLDDCSRVGTAYTVHVLSRSFSDDAGMEADYREAIRYYAKACIGGSALGCYQQGFALELASRFIPDGYTQAAALHQKACDGGSADGCNSLASSYEHGVGGLTKDVAAAASLRRKAVTLYERACARGDAASCGSAAYAYATGAGGIAIDRDRADRLFDQACKGGNQMACKSPLWRGQPLRR